MKKLLVVFVVFALLLTIAVPALAAKPDVPPGQAKKAEKVKVEKEVRKEEQKMKENGAIKYDFFLSADVMPVPPYGDVDIEGSDEKSKLIVNQPNGVPVANVTGVMKGLIPETEYTVFISNGYMPFLVNDVWNVLGDYVITLDYNGTLIEHDISITSQDEGIIVGVGGYPASGPYTIDEEITGVLDENSLYLHSEYMTGTNIGYVYEIELTIDEFGVLTGTWTSNGEILVTDRPLTILPALVGKMTEGNTGWPGLLSLDLLPAFTFTTDVEGHGNFHVNILKEMLTCEDGTDEFSIWINGAGGTILISETVVIECDCEEVVVAEIE